MSPLNLITILLTSYLAVFFESWQSGIREVTGAQIDVLPSLMVYCALNTSVAVFTAIAIALGLMFDTLSANPLGITILPLFLVAFGVHWHRELILRDQRYAQFVLGCLASAAAPLLTLVFLIGGGHRPLLGLGSIWQLVVMTFAGGAFCPIFFWLFDRLNRAFSYQRLPETSFREDREIKRGRF
jgi:rod shape-determining protein MreD